VSISTDEELILAIGGLQSTVFKLYLKKAEQPQQHPRPCQPCGPPHFATFNPWAGLYQPRGGYCHRQYPRTTPTQPNKTIDESQFVLTPDERECVQNIGGAVSNFLKPYGINIDVNVANIPNGELLPQCV